MRQCEITVSVMCIGSKYSTIITKYVPKKTSFFITRTAQQL